MSNEKWWFGFRQVLPAPPGRWVGSGPHDSYSKALAASERAKQRDCEISAPFQAETQAEADKKAQLLFGVQG
jgi:hypothetical protein